MSPSRPSGTEPCSCVQAIGDKALLTTYGLATRKPEHPARDHAAEMAAAFISLTPKEVCNGHV